MLSQDSSPDYRAAGVREHNLLLKIWGQPQATLHYILTHCPNRHVTLLMLLGGIARMLWHVNPEHPLPSSALPVAVVIGSLSGWIFYYVYARGLLIAGKLLHGPADFAVFETIVAWALVPTIASVPVLLLLDTDAQRILLNQFTGLPVPWDALTRLTRVVQLVLAGWSLTILFKGIRLVQGFSAGKTLLNMVLPGGLLLLLVGAFLLLQGALEAAS